VNEHADPEASEPTAPNLEAAPPATAAATGAAVAGAGRREHRRSAGAVRTAATSRGAGWGVAAALAGLIAGYAIGHSTGSSSSPGVVLRSVSVGPVQRQAVVAPGAGVFGGSIAGMGPLGLGCGGFVSVPGLQVPFAGPGAVHVQIVRPPSRGALHYQVVRPRRFILGPAVVAPRMIFLGPAGPRTIVLSPARQRMIILGPGGQRAIVLGPAGPFGPVAPGAIVQRIHGGPGGLAITCVGGAQP
jgi:hypothetical protein